MQTGRRKLLLADDSLTYRKVISLTFADEGMEVVTASDGEEALRLLEAEPPPDIVLADVVMPGPNGYQLCERVKRDERLRHVPVILLVGKYEPFNEAEARRVGADTFLTKPFQPIRDLIHKVGSLLGGGGEQKPEAERAEGEAAADARAESAGEALTLQADVPVERPESETFAPRGAESAGYADAGVLHQADPSASFADLGADDEMIEAKPAETFAAAAGHAHGDATPAAHGGGGDSAFDAHETRETPAFGAQARPSFEARVEPSFAASESAAVGASNASSSPQPSFSAHASGAAAADDALLDLGQMEPPASEALGEADDFILDLDDGEDLLPLAPAAHGETREAAAPSIFDAPEDASAEADSAGAFAEAAHGETNPAREPHAAFPFASASSDFSEYESEFTPSESGFTSSSGDDAGVVAAEVVTQDEPQLQDFSRSGEPTADAVATSYPGGRQEFIEPSVVAADAPAPAEVPTEFTDGSVEGDLPKAPPSGFIPSADAPAVSAPSTEGFAVGEARAGVEETLRPEQLSPEAIDAIARRVVELMSDKVVREIAWEVVPDLAELLIKRKLGEERGRS